jgi:hypothetical protein
MNQVIQTEGTLIASGVSCPFEINPVISGCTGNLVFGLDKTSLSLITSATKELVELDIDTTGNVFQLKFNYDAAFPEGDYNFTIRAFLA